MVVKINVVRRNYLAQVGKLQQLDIQLDRITVEESVMTINLRERKALLAERLRQAYDTDRTSMLETFLSAGSFTDVLSQVSYTIDVGEQDKALAEQIVSDQEALDAIHQSVAETRDRHRRAADRDRRPEGQARRRAQGAEGRPEGAPQARGRHGSRPRDPEGGLPQARGQQDEPRQGDEDHGQGQGCARPPDQRPRRAAVRPGQHPVAVQRHAEVADGRTGHPGLRLHRLQLGAAARVMRPLPPGHRHRRPERDPGEVVGRRQRSSTAAGTTPTAPIRPGS